MHDWLDVSSPEVSVYAILCCTYYTSMVSNVRKQVNRLSVRGLEVPKGFLMHLDASPFYTFYDVFWSLCDSSSLLKYKVKSSMLQLVQH